MSVRRLADDHVQPAGFAYNREFAAQAKVWIKKYPKGREQSAVIPLLMLAQEQDGWLTKRAIEHVATLLAMPYIRALEVATFYTQFQLKPVGTRAHVQVCGTTPCMLRGSEALMDVCRRKIHPEPFHLNETGTLSWEEVECQGACVNAPMVMIFKDSYEDLSPERLAYVIDRFEAGRPEEIRPGPQINRIFSAPAGGLTSLKEKASVRPVGKAAVKGPSNPSRSATASAPTKPGKPAVTVAGAGAAHTPQGSTASTVKTDATQAVDTGLDKSATIADPAIPGDAPGSGQSGPAAKPSKSVPAPTVLVADKTRPAGIERPASPDDLKLISGVGPKIEGVLHSLGIYTFAQVAGWTKTERDWVDGYLKFSGRIERDDWTRQADALAKGGEAEYIKVFGRKPR